MQKMYEYTVSGTSTFPWDMLRYDHCYPADQESASKLSHDGPRADAEWHRVSRKVRIRSQYPPTEDRWKSFGWLVMDTKKS